ncbi:hypothetical protein [Psychrobacillus lasiicapitis]
MEPSNKIVVVVKGLVVNEGRVLIVQRTAADEIGSGTPFKRTSESFVGI